MTEVELPIFIPWPPTPEQRATHARLHEARKLRRRLREVAGDNEAEATVLRRLHELEGLRRIKMNSADFERMASSRTVGFGWARPMRDPAKWRAAQAHAAKAAELRQPPDANLREAQELRARLHRLLRQRTPTARAETKRLIARLRALG